MPALRLRPRRLRGWGGRCQRLAHRTLQALGARQWRWLQRLHRQQRQIIVTLGTRAATIATTHATRQACAVTGWPVAASTVRVARGVTLHMASMSCASDHVVVAGQVVAAVEVGAETVGVEVEIDLKAAGPEVEPDPDLAGHRSV